MVFHLIALNIVGTFAFGLRNHMKLLSHFMLSILILMGIGSSNSALADHVLGGSISWDCITTGADAGKFQFYLTIYRNCASNQAITPFIKSETYAPLGNISMTQLSSTDVSPTQCGVSCATANPGDAGLIEEIIFQSAPVIIDETPPATGHVFSYYACCRGDVDNIVNPLTYLMYFRAVMYPYAGQNMNPCYDSSPRFVAPSNSLLCSGYKFRYSTAAVDPDQDSLSYDWSQTYGYDDNVNETIPVTFQPGFSFNAPLPGPNPSSLDQSTGMISYDTDVALQGKWNMTVAAYGWRNGTLVSENTRELVLETSSCPIANQVPQVNGAANTSIVVNAGDLVTFDIGAIDPDQPLGLPQDITMTAIGSQFSNNFTDVNGCANPPCATLTNTPPAIGSAAVNTTFNWQTDCAHLPTFAEFAVTSYTYNFVFRFEDNHCPIPGISYANVSVTVLGDEVLPSPDPRCVSIIDNDNIQLEWQPITPIVPMPASFEYVIYHSPTGLLGSWTEIGTETNVGIGSFIHSTGMAANPISTGPNFYQVRTQSGCLTNPVVDAALYTVSSIYLDITNNGSTVDLNWTPVSTPPLPSSNGGGTGLYQIYEEVPAGSSNWSLIFETTDVSYTFPVTVCEDDPRNYRIELSDNLACSSVSNEEETVLNDPTSPEPQPLDSVSVMYDPISGNELAVLGWPPNSSLNVTEYTIIQNDLDPVLPLFNVLDVVLGYNNTYYQNDASLAGDQKECYRIRARSGCGVSGVQYPIDQIQCTMLLDVELEPCAKTNHLTWTRYFSWDEGVREYEILMSKDGGPELKIAVIEDPLDSTYSHENLQLAANYCYRVRAVRNVGNERITSTSNQECELVFISKIPDFHYAFSTTVPNNDKILYHLFVDSTAGITGFEILRGPSPDNFGVAGTMAFDTTSQIYEYSDFRAKPDIKAYYHASVALDACDEPMDTSNITRTIFLDAEAFADRTNVLTWNSYEGWPDGVEYYNIYRDYSGSDYKYLATVPSTTLTYTDNVIDIILGEGNFCYYVEAVETGPFLIGNPLHSFDETSTSNVACAPQHPNIFVPNAFAPNGFNKVFLPVSIYVDFQSYVFTVYDRFGGKILRTKSTKLGWDGMLGNGMEAAQGVYAYTVEYETAAGIAGVQTGTITLYR